METPILEMIATYVMPLVPKSAMLDQFAWCFRSAVSLNYLAIPSRPRSIPFDDEVEKTGGSYVQPLFLLLLALGGGMAALLMSN